VTRPFRLSDDPEQQLRERAALGRQLVLEQVFARPDLPRACASAPTALEDGEPFVPRLREPLEGSDKQRIRGLDDALFVSTDSGRKRLASPARCRFHAKGGVRPSGARGGGKHIVRMRCVSAPADRVGESSPGRRTLYAMPPTQEQQAVVDHGTAPARLLAGPGTGKSYTLAARIAALVAGGENPRRMLAISFTRLAADELASAIASEDLGDQEPPDSRTLHSYSFRQLREHSAEAYVGRHVVDKWELDQAIRLDLGRRVGLSPGRVTELLAEYDAAWRTVSDPPTFPQRHAFESALEALRGVLRFALLGELVFKFLRYLDADPEFDPGLEYLIVDEYQDLNRCDQEVIARLAARGAALLIAGDDDQSLYGFRHANPQGIMDFVSRFEGCSDFSLDECRRCSSQVLAAAMRVISYNPNRVDKQLRALREGGEVRAFSFQGPRRQAVGIAEMVAAEIAQGTDPSQVFVLLPRKAHAAPILEELQNRDIPAIDLANGVALLDDPEVRRLTYLLRFAADGGDAMAVRGWLATTAGVGPGRVGRVVDLAIDNRLDFVSAIEQSDVEPVKEALHELQTAADNIDSEADPLEALDIGAQVLDLPEDKRSDLREIVVSVIGDQDMSLGQVLAVLHEYRDQPQVAEEAPESPIRLMTLHGAKGLSADAVIVADLNDEIIPGDADVEEQRRLFYVSMTRARHRLYLCHVKWRMDRTSYAGSGSRAPGPERRRSRFLDEAEIRSETWNA
jgi:DNA helicase-2/ATP-dependent DNA helicase PcrA